MTSVCNIFFEAPDQNRTQQIVTTEDSHVIVTSFTAPPSPNVKLGELGSRTDKDEQSRDTSGIPAICKYGGVHLNGTCHIKPPAPEIEIYPVNVRNINQQMEATTRSPRYLADGPNEVKKNFQHFSANRLSPTDLMIRRAKTLKEASKLREESIVKKSQSLGHQNRGITTNELVINLRQRYPTNRFTSQEKEGKLPQIALASPRVSLSTDKIPSVTTRSVTSRMETIKRESEKDLTPLMRLLRQQLAERFQEALARKSICKSSLNSFVSIDPEKKLQVEQSLTKGICNDFTTKSAENEEPKNALSEIEVSNGLSTVKIQPITPENENTSLSLTGNENNDVITTIRVRSPKHFTTSVTKSEDFSGSTHVVNYQVEIDVNEKKDEKDENTNTYSFISENEASQEDEKPKLRKKSSGSSDPVGILRSPTNFDLKMASQRSVSFALDLEHIRVMSPRPSFSYDLQVKSTSSGAKSKRRSSSKLTK